MPTSRPKARPSAPVKRSAQPQKAQPRRPAPQQRQSVQPQQAARSQGYQGQQQSQQQGAMSPPLPFQFMKGFVRIYKIVDKDTVNGPRTFVYYVDNASQEKFKWSTGDPAYVDVLKQIEEQVPGDFNVNWSWRRSEGNVTLSIEPA